MGPDYKIYLVFRDIYISTVNYFCMAPGLLYCLGQRTASYLIIAQIAGYFK